MNDAQDDTAPERSDQPAVPGCATMSARTTTRLPARRVWLVIVGALLLALPALAGGSQLGLPTDICLYAIFALTYDLLFGYVGLISFGQALFVGGGAYALAIAMTQHGLSLLPALLIAVCTGVVLALVTGALALRTRSVYFTMITLAFAQAAFTLTQSDVGNLTGGENGMPVNGAPAWLTGPGSGPHIYYVALVALGVCYLLLQFCVRSPAGSVWQAIRENEHRATMLGYRPYQFKLLAYAIAGGMGALAGALYALSIGAVSPNLLAADLTIQLLLMVIIGGAGTLWGAVLGAVIIRALNHYLTIFSTSGLVTTLPAWLANTLGQPLLILGCVYLLAVYFFSGGIAGLAQTTALRRRARASSNIAVLPPPSERSS